MPDRRSRTMSDRRSRTMSDRRSRTVPVLLAALVLVLGANVAAYAANGRPLLLGQENTETRPATVRNTHAGPALDLVTKPGAPPMAVSSSKVVKRLNADQVDGLDADDLRTVAGRYLLPHTEPENAIAFDFPDLPRGTWVASYSILTRHSTTRPVCYFRQTDMLAAQALSLGVESGGGFHSLSATAVVDSAGGPVTLYCGGQGFSIYSVAHDTQSTVTFLPVSRARQGTVATTYPRRAPRTAPTVR